MILIYSASGARRGRRPAMDEAHRARRRSRRRTTPSPRAPGPDKTDGVGTRTLDLVTLVDPVADTIASVSRGTFEPRLADQALRPWAGRTPGRGHMALTAAELHGHVSRTSTENVSRTPPTRARHGAHRHPRTRHTHDLHVHPGPRARPVRARRRHSPPTACPRRAPPPPPEPAPGTRDGPSSVTTVHGRTDVLVSPHAIPVIIELNLHRVRRCSLAVAVPLVEAHPTFGVDDTRLVEVSRRPAPTRR